ncbi:MAG: phosphate signaling complex protein PhoU [Planctomycetota bacterium]
MGAHLQVDLADLEQLLSAQADKVEEMVLASCQAMHERSIDKAVEVFAGEIEINASEVEIEELCLHVLALQQPVAIDLRRVTAILKINGELERIADLAVNVAERTKSLDDYPSVHVPERLEQMLETSLQMLRDAHSALLRVDADLAREVIRRDDEVDRINRQVINDLVRWMEAEPASVAGYLHVFSACRMIERIGDHATNIAEDVVYLAEGEISRHAYTHSLIAGAVR